MRFLIKILLLLFCSVYLIFHFYTLSLNPIPWLDEVYFASISKSIMETGKLIPIISKETWYGEEVLIYGPIHFIFGSISFNLFDFGLLQYRAITFVFGILTILSSACILKIYYPSWKYIYLFVLIFSLDPFFQLSLHEGRMDLTAIFFLITGILFLLYGIKNKKRYYFFFLEQ